MQSLLEVTAVTARPLGKGGKRGKFTASFSRRKTKWRGMTLEITSVLRAADVKNIPHIPAFPTQPNRRAILPAAGTNHHNHAHRVSGPDQPMVTVSRGCGKLNTIQLVRVLPGAGAYAVVANALWLCRDSNSLGGLT
jgi:hypothetical protein